MRPGCWRLLRRWRSKPMQETDEELSRLTTAGIALAIANRHIDTIVQIAVDRYLAASDEDQRNIVDRILASEGIAVLSEASFRKVVVGLARPIFHQVVRRLQMVLEDALFRAYSKGDGDGY